MSITQPNPPHDEAACFELHREQWAVTTVARFTVDGEPVSKARARVTKRGGAYTPQKTRNAEQMMAWRFKESAPGHTLDPKVTYGVMGLFFAGTNQRRDVDNMLKLICDALNGVAWVDDSQVCEISGRRGYDSKENARTEVWVYEVSQRTDITRLCDQCGAEFSIPPSWSTRKKFCSNSCAGLARRLPLTVDCAGCGVSFTRPRLSSQQKFCSRACSNGSKRVALECVVCQTSYTYPRSLAPRQVATCSDDCRATYWREQRKTAAQGTCDDCGGPTSKKSYARCQPCSFTWAASRAKRPTGAMRKVQP